MGESHPLSKGLSLKRLGREITQNVSVLWSGCCSGAAMGKLPTAPPNLGTQTSEEQGTGPLHRGVGTRGSHLCFSKVLHRVREPREKHKDRSMPEMNPLQKIPHTSPPPAPPPPSKEGLFLGTIKVLTHSSRGRESEKKGRSQRRGGISPP